MALLASTSLFWIVLHIGLAGTRLRDAIVAKIGDGGFRGLFSLLSVAALTALIQSWRTAPIVPLWATSDGLRVGLLACMLPASMLLVGAFVVRSPTAVGIDPAKVHGPEGMLRITRHPMLWSFGLWALVHCLGNGDLASVLFFGSFAVTAFAGMPSIDAKIGRRSPDAWRRFAGQTSVLPFLAIVQGRTRFMADGKLFAAVIGGIAFWAGLIAIHPAAFGVAVLPN